MTKNIEKQGRQSSQTYRHTFLKDTNMYIYLCMKVALSVYVQTILILIE